MIFILTSTILMGSGCEKDQLAVDLTPCNLSDMIKPVSNSKGMVWFNSSINSYIIYVGIEGTYDSQDVGVVCNLPTKYQVNGLKVIFSGKYFKYQKDVLQKLPGQTYYNLELSKIELSKVLSNN